MNNSKLEENILTRTKIFKNRAKRDELRKRHDPIRPDEKEWMVKAQGKLGWSCRRIASEFDRDWRTVTRIIEKSHTPPKEKMVTGQHAQELSAVAKVFYDVQMYHAAYGPKEPYKVTATGNIAGMYIFNPKPKHEPKTESFAGAVVAVDSRAAEYFFKHFLDVSYSPKLRVWENLVTSKLPQDAVDWLRYLGNTARFRYCEDCQVCIDLATML